MRSRVRVAVPAAALALAALVLAGAQGGGAAPRVVRLGQSRWAPGRLIVRFRPWADSLSRRQALAAQGASTIQPLGLPGLQLVRIASGRPVKEPVPAFESDP